MDLIGAIDDKRWGRLRRFLPPETRRGTKAADGILTAAVQALATEAGAPRLHTEEVLRGLRLSA